MKDFRFHNTFHFAKRADLRNLSIENVKNVVRYPKHKTRQRPGVRGGVVWLFTKTVDGVTLCVAAEIKNRECWLLTAYEKT